MQQLIAIALGGSIGAVLRFLVANSIYAALGRNFPYGTLFINVSGSLLMGFLTEIMVHRLALAVEYRAAVLIGFLGAFTTFSTFALETLTLFETGSLAKALLNMFLSVALCLTACWVGLLWGRALSTPTLTTVLPHLPLTGMLFSFLSLFIISLLAQMLIHHLNLSTEVRTVFFVGLLGSLSIGTTLWLSFASPELQANFQHLLGLFLFNTVLGVLIIWSGAWIGHWIWQLKLSA